MLLRQDTIPRRICQNGIVIFLFFQNLGDVDERIKHVDNYTQDLAERQLKMEYKIDYMLKMIKREKAEYFKKKKQGSNDPNAQNGGNFMSMISENMESRGQDRKNLLEIPGIESDIEVIEHQGPHEVLDTQNLHNRFVDYDS